MANLPPNPTTELRCMISEGPDGNLIVEHQTLIKGTGVTVNMRPSHVAGQLVAAALVLLSREYSSVRELRKVKKRK